MTDTETSDPITINREKLKYALELSFIGLCKNFFCCTETCLTIQGSLILKNGNEEICTLNFNDIISNENSNFRYKSRKKDIKENVGILRFAKKIIQVDDECSNSENALKLLEAATNTSLDKNKTCNNDIGRFLNCETCTEPKLKAASNSGNLFGEFQTYVDPTDSEMSAGVEVDDESLSHLTKLQTFSNTYKTFAEVVEENFKVTNKYQGPDHIRCCACKSSDTEDCNWDDDKTSVVVDDDVSESFVPGKLCLESIEDETISPGKVPDGKPFDSPANDYNKFPAKNTHAHNPNCDVINHNTIKKKNCSLSEKIKNRKYSSHSHNDKKKLNTSHVSSMWRNNSRYRHVCLMCGMAFTFRTNLTRHAKKIHGCRPDNSHENRYGRNN